jgi:phosphatidylethanolamine-binding protein (PEBP) family uncharacterized protein
VFQLFALREPLGVADGAPTVEFKRAVEGKVLAWGELTGRYEL